MDKQIEEMAKTFCPYEYNKRTYQNCEQCRKALMTGCEYYKKATALYKAGYRKTHECVVDYIENYKEGFKEGVIAFRTQLEERASKIIECVNGVEIMPPVNYSSTPALLDEICKELVDE